MKYVHKYILTYWHKDVDKKKIFPKILDNSILEISRDNITQTSSFPHTYYTTITMHISSQRKNQTSLFDLNDFSL